MKQRHRNRMYGRDHIHETKRHQFATFGYLTDEEIEEEIEIARQDLESQKTTK